MQNEIDKERLHEAYKQLVRLMLQDFALDLLQTDLSSKSTVKDLCDWIYEWSEKHFREARDDWNPNDLSPEQETGLNRKREVPDV